MTLFEVYSQDRVSQRTVEQLVDIPVPGDGLDHGDHPGLRLGQGSTARRGAVSSTACRGARARGGGAQGRVPGQGSTASQVLVVLDAAGRDGSVDSLSAQAELNSGGNFRFSASYWGRFVGGADVWFSARQLPSSRWEAFELVER